MMRENFSSGSNFEAMWGYSRAVRVGRRLWISGTIGYDYATMDIAPDVAGQVRQCVANIRPALAAMGSDLSAIVSLEIYVTDPALAGAALDAAAAEQNAPAATTTVVGFPYGPQVLVELRPFAILPEETPS